MHSLQSLASRLSAELGTQKTLATALREWLASVDPAAYSGELPWRTEVQAAYNEYKRLAEEHARAHIAFTTYLRQTSDHPTPEQHLERARLAIVWGEAAVRYVILKLSAGTVIFLTLCPTP